MERAFADHAVQAVIHAGALHKPDIARYPTQAFIDVNVTGTLNLLRAATEAGHDRFVFTSTTSLMITQAIREEAGDAAVWLDESAGPLEPRNIYGVTKLAAEGLCRLYAREHGLACIVLRTGRFFPEEDDTQRDAFRREHEGERVPPPTADGRGCGRGACRGARPCAGDRFRDLRPRRTDALRAR